MGPDRRHVRVQCIPRTPLTFFSRFLSLPLIKPYTHATDPGLVGGLRVRALLPLMRQACESCTDTERLWGAVGQAGGWVGWEDLRLGYAIRSAAS